MRAQLIFWFCAVIGLASSEANARADDGKQVTEGIVGASLDEVWNAFTTKKGLESWMVAHAEIELKVGGQMRTHYNPKGKIGDPGTIVNTILSYDPKRMISIKATGLPKGFPFPKAVQNVWHVIYFEKMGPKRTRVTEIGLGYGTDEDSKKLRAFFERGNDFTMKSLQKHFSGAARPKE